MRKLLVISVIACLLLSAVGCTSKQAHLPAVTPEGTHITNDDHTTTTPPSDTELSTCAIVLPSIKESVTAEDGTTLFSLSFQQIQLLLSDPLLEEKILGDLQTRNGSILSQAEEAENQARADYPQSELWSEYFIDISYTPTRLDNTVLSLFCNSVSYRGGPHPSVVTDSVTYDLETGDELWLDDILAPECTSDTLLQLILQKLTEQQDALYYDYAEALSERFSDNLHNVRGWYFSQRGLCFHFTPYDIAPYSSGTIIAELPYDTLDGILKEKYVPVATSAATGSIYAESYSIEANERFDSILNVTLCENADEVLLYADALVTDLRIEVGWRYAENDQYIPRSTVFAANIMNIGQAIHLTSDLNDEEMLLRIIYHADGQEYSSFITYDTLANSISLSNY